MTVSKQATDPLTIRLLGPPQVLYQGRPLKFRSRKVLALLIYLVVEGGQHQRDKLADLLWPESDQQRARTALRNTLTRLRQSLAEAGEFIIAEGSLVSFDFEQAFDLDVRAVDAVASALSAETPLDVLQTALKRVGDEFLEGFSLPDAPDFENWVSGQREWQHRRGEALFAETVRRQIEMGRFSEAVEIATGWTRYAPLTETAHCSLIEAYALSGDRSAALQAYETCQKILADELGVSPSTETTALAERVKQNEITRARRQMAASQSSAAEATPAAPSTPQPLVIPLVGRSTEYSRLVAIYRQAAQGQFQTAALVGEAGMGKTRLAETFLDWAVLTEPPADVLRGRAFEIGGTLPYQPVVDALRLRLDRENAPDDLLDDVWLAELSQLLPELRSRYPDLPPPMAGNADFVQARLFEAVAHLGVALAERQPLILFIDDAQWADTGSREMLHYLARRWSVLKTPALLLLTIRQEGLLTMPTLREWVLGLGRDVPLTRLDLSPLTQADLTELAQMMTSDDTASAQFGDWLAVETGGSPFFMAEMLQLLQQQTLLVAETQATGRLSINLAATLERLQTGQRIPLPPTIRDLVLSRVARLSERANVLLLAGAVIGRQCSFERLCQVARLDEFEGLPALEELLNSRLMLETNDEARPFTFAHDNIRDVVYTEAGSTRRRIYHRQTFTALEQVKAPAAELAFHAATAGLHQAAFTYAVTAGDEALALHAFVDAVAFYEQALNLVDRVEVTSSQLCHLCTHYGRSLELSGRYQDALDHYIEATASARQSGNKELELVTLVAQGTIRATANELSDFVVGESLGQAALTLARELNDKAAEAKIQWNLLNVYRFTGRPQLAQAAGERSLALAQELNLREQTAYAANDLMYLYQQTGNFERLHIVANIALKLWRALGNQPMLTDILAGYGNVTAMTADYETALTMAIEAQRISESLENEWAQSFSLFPQSFVYQRRLTVDKVLAVMEASLHLARKVRFTGGQIIVGAMQADLYLAMGAIDQARTAAQSALDIATKHLPLFAATAAGVLARIELRAGNLAEADQILQAHPLNETDFDAINMLSLETATCRRMLHQKDFKAALAFSQKVLLFCKERNLRMFVSDFLYLQAQALVGLNRFDEARKSLAQALVILRETGGRWHFLEIAGLLVDLEEQAGNAATVKDLCHEARTTLDNTVEHIPEGELRVSFLELPHVQQVLDRTEQS